MSFLQKMQMAENGKYICRISAPVGGVMTWFFIKVHPAKATMFNKVVFSRACNLADFGEILARGEGEMPPQSVIDEMIEKYGYKPRS